MAVTPEGKIKKLVKAVLAKYNPRYEYWPVPGGYGASSLDCLVCYHGWFIAIETKAPGKKPTPRQELCIDEIKQAHGTVLVIDSEEGCRELERRLEWIKNVADNYQRQAQADRGAGDGPNQGPVP